MEMGPGDEGVSECFAETGHCIQFTGHAIFMGENNAGVQTSVCRNTDPDLPEYRPGFAEVQKFSYKARFATSKQSKLKLALFRWSIYKMYVAGMTKMEKNTDICYQRQKFSIFRLTRSGTNLTMVIYEARRGRPGSKPLPSFLSTSDQRNEP